MASRFIWFLGSLLALLFCLIAETETANDTLEKMQIAGRKMLSKQFAVLHLPGKNIGGCSRIKFNNPEGVDAHCNFAPVFEERNETKEENETRRHSEWQLIHTALKPMLEEWKKKYGEKKCPEKLYLYTFNAPDYDRNRTAYNLTCTQAIVYKIPKILKEDGCDRTSIVVGFSQVRNHYKNDTLNGCELMKENGIIEYNLNNGRSNKEDHCRLVAEIGVQNTG
ncbi:uncharacterized protein [Penaeus vannamei]|uniref:uncharacterized protein n=1 Tax=Penaeus vannamei TaxID=6689 RepID=UPI00387F51F0